MVNNETDGFFSDERMMSTFKGQIWNIHEALTRMNVHALALFCLLQHRFTISHSYNFSMFVSWTEIRLKPWASKTNLPPVLMYHSLIVSSMNVIANWVPGFLSNGCVTWLILFHAGEHSAWLCCSAGSHGVDDGWQHFLLNRSLTGC